MRVELTRVEPMSVRHVEDDVLVCLTTGSRDPTGGRASIERISHDSISVQSVAGFAWIYGRTFLHGGFFFYLSELNLIRDRDSIG
jgi:hypothetical protein